MRIQKAGCTEQEKTKGGFEKDRLRSISQFEGEGVLSVGLVDGMKAHSFST
jgi:hypothetical protein